jgi:hypothetical protein
MNAVQRLSARYRTGVEPLRSERRVELLVLALLLVLLLQAALLAWTSMAGGRVEPVLPAADSMRVAVPVSPGSIASTDSAQVQSRPLFWPSRRPVPGESTADPLAVQETVQSGRRLQGLSVTGVFGAGADGGVIISYKGRQARLRIGEALDGWILESVAPGEAVFASAGDRDVRRLRPRPVAGSVDEQASVQEPADDRGGVAAPPRPATTPARTSVARSTAGAASSSVARPSRSRPGPAR